MPALKSVCVPWHVPSRLKIAFNLLNGAESNAASFAHGEVVFPMGTARFMLMLLSWT